MKLTGKAALITGGGRGIGRAIVLACAGAGADVAVLGRTWSEIDAVAAEIAAMGRLGVAEVCDVTDCTAVDRAVVSAVEKLGRLDILVNNAGGGTERTYIGDDDPENWVRVIELNLHGTYFCTRAALPYLKAAGGANIINIGSGMGHQPRKGNSSYNSAKAGVWMLTRCLAMELWSDGIEVNELIPGPVYTELTSNIFPQAGAHPQIEGEQIKRPEDVVPIAMFLATHPPGGPTGQSFSLARRPI